MKYKKIICDKCSGTGTLSFDFCPKCYGLGTLSVPMTNSDFIRQMNDEELTDFLAEMCEYGANHVDRFSLKKAKDGILKALQEIYDGRE